MPDLCARLTPAQRMRALGRDALDIADRMDEPSGITNAEAIIADTEALALDMWAVGRGRRPAGWE
jgi:hypothetical protein